MGSVNAQLLPLIGAQTSTKCSKAFDSFHGLCAAGMCQALEASLAANTCPSASSCQQAGAVKLLQQAVVVLGLAPGQLFPGLLRGLEEKIKGSYEGKLKIANAKVVMAEVICSLIGDLPAWGVALGCMGLPCGYQCNEACMHAWMHPGGGVLSYG